MILAGDEVCSTGVVVDSDPEYEFQECLGKARALVEAIDYAREGVD